MYSMKERRLDSSQTEIISCVRRREQLMVRDSIKYIKKKKKKKSLTCKKDMWQFIRLG
jgi:hypothetical protein